MSKIDVYASRLANIISTNKTLVDLNDNSIDELKNHLFSELNVTDEKSFLSKILTHIYPKLSIQSTISIKNKAIEIKDKQKKNDHSINNKTRNDIGKSCLFSLLPSVSIDDIGSFLTKSESIIVGYLNRHFYIESQKLTFVTKQEPSSAGCKDNTKIDCLDSLKIEITEENKLCQLKYSPNTMPFAYNFPLTVELNFYDDENFSWYKWETLANRWKCAFKSQWFRMLFTRIDTLIINHPAYLSYIPIEILFNKNNKLNKNKDIKKISICWESTDYADPDTGEIDYALNIVKKFCQKYQNYFQNTCQTKLSKIRRIKELDLYCFAYYGGNEICMEFISGISPNFEKLILGDYAIKFYNTIHIRKCFHYNLKQLEICYARSLTIENQKQGEKEMTMSMVSNSTNTNDKLAQNIDTISFSNWKVLKNLVSILSWLRKSNNNACKKMSNIKIQAESRDTTQVIERNVTLKNDAKLGLGYILQNKDNIFDSLTKVEFIINESVESSFPLIGALLSFLIENRNEILFHPTVVFKCNVAFYKRLGEDTTTIADLSKYNFDAMINLDRNAVLQAYNNTSNNEMYAQYLKLQASRQEDCEQEIAIQYQINLCDKNCFLFCYKLLNFCNAIKGSKNVAYIECKLR